jgi:YihY family inner membrane protein
MRRKVEKLGSWARNWARVRQVLGDSLLHFYNENSLMIAASMAYYSLLSLFPLMLLVLGLSGALISHYEFAGRLSLVLERFLPMPPDFIMRNLVSISRAYGTVSVASFMLLLWSSSGMFLPIEKSLNRAWQVEKGRRWWRSRLVALEMSLILSFLILVSSGLMALNVDIHILLQQWTFYGVKALLDLAYHGLILTTTFAVTLAMFLVLFERLPNRPMQLRQVFPSALLTALFWEAARSLFTLLLPFFNYRHVYGSIGVVVALMTWAYVSSAVTLFGAQVSHTLYGTLKVSSPAEAPIPSPADVL